MTKFVEAEYFIATMLIKRNISSISLDELARCGIFLQGCSVGNKIDAVFMTSKPQVMDAVYYFSDYFDFIRDEETEQITQVKIVSSKKIDDLRNRFMGYMPDEVMRFIEETIDEFIAREESSRL